jgi:glycosyltransferase involved in cell wall biosynthesis
VSSPTVTVVIPTRNRVRMLAQTLHTALSQDVDLEVVVVDEGSSDDTPAFLAAIPDPRVRVVRHDQPRGLANARNAGIDAARGRWLAFTDDDDLWFPGKLRDQLAAAQAADTDWAYGGAIIFKDGPVLLNVRDPTSLTAPPERMPWHNVVPGGGSNVLVSRAALDRVGGFDTAHPIVADWDLSIRLLQDQYPAVIARPVVAYRIHTGNMSNGLDTMLAGMEAVEERYHALRGGEPIDRIVQNRYLAVWAFRSGNLAAARKLSLTGLRAGDPHAARRLLRTSIPIAGRDPVTSQHVPVTLLDRLFPRQVIDWPPGAQEWLRRALAIFPEDVTSLRT